MVKILVGHAGTGKTKNMIELANEGVEKAMGSIVFINKNHSLMFDLKHDIRVVCMEDFPHITNSDEYIGFIYGILSSNNDIEAIYIDGIMHHADVSLGNLPEFLERIKDIAREYDIEITVSLSAAREEMIGVNFENVKVLN